MLPRYIPMPQVKEMREPDAELLNAPVGCPFPAGPLAVVTRIPRDSH